MSAARSRRCGPESWPWYSMSSASSALGAALASDGAMSAVRRMALRRSSATDREVSGRFEPAPTALGAAAPAPLMHASNA